MPTWDPYKIIRGNWAWADDAQSVFGPMWATQCTPMAAIHAASGGRQTAGDAGMPGHFAAQQRVVHADYVGLVVVYDSLSQINVKKLSSLKLRVRTT